MAGLTTNIRKLCINWGVTARNLSKKLPKVSTTKCAVVAAGFTGFSVSLYCIRRNNTLFSPTISNPVAKENHQKEDKRQALQTAREIRFLSFASIDYQGNIFMTPQDFLESVTEESPRARVGRRRLKDADMESALKKTPAHNRGSPNLFRNLCENGLISYTEYLFLLCVLTKPQSGFRIAFNMFDTDGNQQVDRKEFLVLEEVVLDQGVSDINRDILVATEVQIMMLKGIKRLSKRSEITSYQLENLLTQPPVSDGSKADRPGSAREKGETSDTTLSRHFFGRKGTNTLRYEDFHRFMDNLQTEVLELEFNEFSRGLQSITEDEFAQILLRYTILSPDEHKLYIDRMKERIPDWKGISFQEFKHFGKFLNNLDDFSLAMKMYSFLGQPISEEDFKRAAKAVTGLALGDHVVHVVFQLFDQDGDGQLSQKEFFSVMKDRLHRGFRSQVRQNSQWDSFKCCVKQEMKTA